MSLKINHHIELKSWMRSLQTKKIMLILQDGKPADDPQALFVGGCVRDSLLGVDVGDVDIATILKPEAVMRLCRDSGVRVIPTGIDHGTVTAIIDKTPYEITTLRRDEETDGRRAVVSYTNDWLEDAKRRDFTMNALYMDISGNVYDPLGLGIDDLSMRRVCFVGQAAQRVEEDYLRILRFFRFSVLYGEGIYDEIGLNACRAGARHIKSLSRERITQELLKILSAKDPAGVLSIMFEAGVLAELDFGAAARSSIKYLSFFQSQYNLLSLPARIWALSAQDDKNMSVIYHHILLPKIFKKDIMAIKKVANMGAMDNDKSVRRSVYMYGRNASAQGMAFDLAHDRINNIYASRALGIIQKWEIPTFPISGKDLIEAGIEKGPSMGAALDKIENWWIDNDFKPGRDDCLAQL